MIIIIIVGAIIGLLLALYYPIHFPPEYTKYVALAILAGVDSVIGGALSVLKKNFDIKVFLTGVAANSLIAAGFAYLGSRLDVDISIAAVVTFGTRIFQNFAIIRRLLLKKFENHSKIKEEG